MRRSRDQAPQGPGTLVRTTIPMSEDAACLGARGVHTREDKIPRQTCLHRPSTSVCAAGSSAGGWRLGLPRLLSRFCPLRGGGTKGPVATVRLLTKIREPVRPALAGA